MHEFGLVEEILRTALRTAEEHGGLPVSRVDLEIGALRQVVPELMRFAFDAASKGTLAENAAFAWRDIPIEIQCGGCGAVYTPANDLWTCPACAAPGGRTLHGDELNIVSITLAEPAGD